MSSIRSLTSRIAALTAALALAGGLSAPAAVAVDNPTEADALGRLAIEPLSGNLTTFMAFTTAGGCPDGTNIITRVYGPGFPSYGENIVGNTDITEFGSPTLDRLRIPSVISLEEARVKQPEGTKLNGRYQIAVTCMGRLGPLFGSYVGELRIGSDGNYRAITTDKDLPSEPRPKSGAAAIELANNPGPAFDPVAEARAAEEKRTADLAALESVAQSDDSGGSASLAIGILAVILTGATGAVFISRRQSGARASQGPSS